MNNEDKTINVMRFTTLEKDDFHEWFEESSTVLPTFQEAGEEIINCHKIVPVEPVRTSHTYTEVMDEDGEISTLKERWDLDLEGNNRKLAKAKEQHETLVKQLKKYRSFLFSSLIKCLSKEVKALVKMEREEYQAALKAVDSFSLFGIIKKVTEHSLVASAEKTLIKYSNARWNRSTTTLNQFILDMERMVDQLNDAGKPQSDEDRTARLADAIKGAGVEFVNRAIYDTQIWDKTDYEYPKYKDIRNALVILERKNPDINAANREDHSKKRKGGHEHDHPRASDHAGNKKGFNKAAHADFNQRLQALEIGVTASNKKIFKGTKGSKGTAYGAKSGFKGKKPSTGKSNVQKQGLNIDDLCWGCGSKDHMRKYCSKVQTCAKCGRKHATHLCDEIGAKFAKQGGGKPAVNAVLGRKTSTNLVMSKLHSRGDYSDSSEDEARDNSCFVIRALPCKCHKSTAPVDSDSDSDVPDLVGSSDEDDGQAPAQRVSQGPVPRLTYAEVLRLRGGSDRHGRDHRTTPGAQRTTPTAEGHRKRTTTKATPNLTARAPKAWHSPILMRYRQKVMNQTSMT